MLIIILKTCICSTSIGTCIDLYIPETVKNIESVNVLPPFCSTHSPVGVDPFQNFQANNIDIKQISNDQKKNPLKHGLDNDWGI